METTFGPSISRVNSITSSAEIGVELENWLSISWVLGSQPTHKTLALVEGYLVYPSHGGDASSMYLTTHEIDLNIVAFENIGHCIEGPEYAYKEGDSHSFENHLDHAWCQLLGTDFANCHR